jgi:glutamine synthetase
MSNELRNFLALTYDELEELNLKAKGAAQEPRPYRQDPGRAAEVPDRRKADQGRDRALQRPRRPPAHAGLRQEVSDQELGQPHLRRLVDSRLHRAARERSAPGHRLGAFYWAPADVFGSGKVLVFGEVIDKGGTPYTADIRGVLKGFAEALYKKKGYTLNAANEIEGFLFKGSDAERRYNETGKFEYVNTGGYYHSLPGDPLRTFIDTTAEVQRAMGFQNEKDHPEVAPSQFEINYGYGEVVAAADQIQLYKLICRRWRPTWA